MFDDLYQQQLKSAINNSASCVGMLERRLGVGFWDLIEWMEDPESRVQLGAPMTVGRRGSVLLIVRRPNTWRVRLPMCACMGETDEGQST
jgi:hypothetical protein